MEGIQAIELRVFMNPIHKDLMRKRLIIASDMIQNTHAHSQLGHLTEFSLFEGSFGYKSVAIEMPNVEVEILYLHRQDGPPFKEHIEFWQQFLRKSTATLKRVQPIAGIS